MSADLFAQMIFGSETNVESGYRITELLKQLFWKENMNQEHNAKHPHRGRRVRESVESDHNSVTLMNPLAAPKSQSLNHSEGWIPPHLAQSSSHPR